MNFRLAVLVGDLVDFCLVCIVIFYFFWSVLLFCCYFVCCTCVHIGALFFSDCTPSMTRKIDRMGKLIVCL